MEARLTEKFYTVTNSVSTMSALIAFIVAHWGEIVAVAAAAHGLALVIVNLTPSKRDDEVYNRVYKVIEVIAGIVTKTAKK